MSVQVLQGDCIQVMKALKDSSVDSVCCDPPYGLEFMGKTWDGSDGFRRSLNPADAGRENVFGRTSKTGPEYKTGRSRIRKQSEHDRTTRDNTHNSTTSLVARNAPEAYVAGPLFQHWCETWAAECLRVLKPGGHLLAFGGTRTYHRMACAIEDAGFEIRDSLHWVYGSGFPKSMDVSKAIDKAAGVEREIIGPMQSVQDHNLPGTGARFRNPDELAGARILVPTSTTPATASAAKWEGWGTALKPSHEPIVVARKPLIGTVAANVLEYGTGALNIDGCRVEGIKDTPASPRRAAQGPAYGDLSKDPGTGSGWDPSTGRWPPNILLDEEMAAEMDRQTGVTKSTIDRNLYKGDTGSWFTSSEHQRESRGDSGGGSRFFPCFKYQAKAKPSERPKIDGIAHPTVKPVELMRWLVRLVTPPGGICLDPFAGSGTTGEACLEEGFNCILIEREPDYIKLINARLDRREPTLWD